jgi:tRNA(Ile)-lysidine synthase
MSKKPAELGLASLAVRVGDFMERLGLTGTPGVAAVSGGPDSVALVRLLAELRGQGRVSELTVAHLNHQLRGADSDADEGFVANLAERLGLRCRTARIDVAARASEQGENLESLARQVRYDWLAGVAGEVGATWVATGHTADDQAETVLHRLLRGSGLHGLGGIPRRRPLRAGIDVVRPLLDASREEVLVYLQSIGQEYCVDRSNADLRFTRNRIRTGLIPELVRVYNPAIVDVLCRLARQAQEAQELMEAEAGRLLTEAELPRAGAMVVLRADRLASAQRHLVRELFRLLWRRENWPAGAMSFADWDRLADLLQTEEGAADLPSGLRGCRIGRVIQLGPGARVV